MLRKITFILGLLFVGASTYAQDFYIKTRGGYGWGVAKDGYYTSEKEGIITPEYSQPIFESLGGGGIIGASVGNYFGEHLGVELDFAYLFGRDRIVADNTNTMFPVSEELEIPMHIKADAYSRQYQIAGSIIMSTGHSKKLSGYTKVGLLIPVGGFSKVTTTMNSMVEEVPMSIEKEEKLYGKIALGCKLAVGAEYKINSRIAAFIEVEGVYLNVKRKKGEVTNFIVNGENAIDQYPGPKEVEYVERLDTNDDPTKKALTSTTAFSKQGINFGFTYYLGKKNKVEHSKDI